MLTTNSNRYVLVLRALATVATPLLAGCSPVESQPSDAALRDETSARADSGVDPACANALAPWTLADLTSRGFCSGPSGADPVAYFTAADAGADVSFDAIRAPQSTDERVLARPCYETSAACRWPGAPEVINGPPVGYICKPTACTRPGGTGFSWGYLFYSNGAGPMAPPELEG